MKGFNNFDNTANFVTFWNTFLIFRIPLKMFGCNLKNSTVRISLSPEDQG